MKGIRLVPLAIALASAHAVTLAAQNPRLPGSRWTVHDLARPRPPVVDPGPERAPAPPPSDAIMLFDGRSLAEWRTGDSAAPRWIVRDGYVEVLPRSGNIVTRRAFGDMQLHLEFATPPAEGQGQERGNSGVFLMGMYEVQILDSWRNDTYPDGMAGALFGQTPPLVNASRAPGHWQTFDIVFRRPRFRPDGSVADSARVTVLHNGVLIHDNVAIMGGTRFMAVPEYAPHAERLPIGLQDHNNRMRFRNIWVRQLE